MDLKLTKSSSYNPDHEVLNLQLNSQGYASDQITSFYAIQISQMNEYQLKPLKIHKSVELEDQELSFDKLDLNISSQSYSVNGPQVGADILNISMELIPNKLYQKQQTYQDVEYKTDWEFKQQYTKQSMSIVSDQLQSLENKTKCKAFGYSGLGVYRDSFNPGIQIQLTPTEETMKSSVEVVEKTIVDWGKQFSALFAQQSIGYHILFESNDPEECGCCEIILHKNQTLTSEECQQFLAHLGLKLPLPQYIQNKVVFIPTLRGIRLLHLPLFEEWDSEEIKQVYLSNVAFRKFVEQTVNELGLFYVPVKIFKFTSNLIWIPEQQENFEHNPFQNEFAESCEKLNQLQENLKGVAELKIKETEQLDAVVKTWGKQSQNPHEDEHIQGQKLEEAQKD